MKSMRLLLSAILTWHILVCSGCDSHQRQPTELTHIDSTVNTEKPAVQDSLVLHLAAEVWRGPFDETLVLKEDGSYEWLLDGEGIACERGTFTHEGSLVLFTHKENCDVAVGRSNLILGNAKCICEKTLTDPLYREILNCESGGRRFQFGNTSLLTQSGDMVEIQSVSCMVMGERGIATQEVRLRSAPSADSALVLIEDPVTGETRDKLKKGEEFIIVAETESLFRIGTWENHWYYIHVNDFTGNAWVFGRYITMEK
jgi:hypothetical protein